MITIIFAQPRTGKTALMTYFLNQYAFDYARYTAMAEGIESLNRSGFNLEIPETCVSANYDIEFFKFGNERKRNRRINPFRLGYPNPMVKTHLNYPFEVIGIQEAQRYFNSRNSKNFPDWQSRFFEQHGHNDLEIFMDVQRPKLIDVNIRELARFIEVLDMDVQYHKLTGEISKVIWHTREFESNYILDIYLDSGKKDDSTFTAKTYVADFNVFDCYDSQNCRTKFYEGREGDDFEIFNDPGDSLPKDFYTTETEFRRRQEKKEKTA